MNISEKYLQKISAKFYNSAIINNSKLYRIKFDENLMYSSRDFATVGSESIVASKKIQEKF